MSREFLLHGLENPTFGKVHKIDRIANALVEGGLIVTGLDNQRPWGGFVVISERSAADFAKIFYTGTPFEELADDGLAKTPKILYVDPEKRLSYQSHNRRSEIWRILKGEPIVTFDDVDKVYLPGQIIEVSLGCKHRIAAGTSEVLIAEIWRHTDPDNPSDENDIIRYQDDHGRETPTIF